MNKIFLSNKEQVKKYNFLHKTNLKKIVFTFILVLLISALIISPHKYISVTLNGILVWSTAILPALFPFMIFTKLLTATGYVEYVSNSLSKITNKLYKVPGISSYIFFMSILSGYPLGAKITADLYEEGLITREESHRVCSFTSNSGPMFIVGTVGIGMFLSSTIGYILLFSHILASLINGLLYRNYKPKKIASDSIEIIDSNLNSKCDKSNCYSNCENKSSNSNYNDIVNKSMENSIMSILLIGGYIAIFFVIIEIFASFHIFYPITQLFSFLGINATLTNGSIFGLFEITKGCLTIASANASMGIKTMLSSFIISFGGLSTAFQSFAFLNKFRISKSFFLLQKLTHAILSLIITLVVILIF